MQNTCGEHLQAALETVVGNAALDSPQGILTIGAGSTNADSNDSLADALVRRLRQSARSRLALVPVYDGFG